MKIGYARVSKKDQNPALQRNALAQAGCSRIFKEKRSGATRQRPQLEAALRALKRGDVLVVWKLDRLGRSLQDLMTILSSLEQRGVHFTCLTECIDTRTASGKLLFHIAGAFAEYERALISERTKAGMEAAKRRGKKMGRRPRLTAKQVEKVRSLARSKRLSLATIAKRMKVGKTTAWRAAQKQIQRPR